MTACDPIAAPLLQPDPVKLDRDDRVVDVRTEPVRGADYVIRVGAGVTAATVVVLVRGRAGLEEVASEVCPAGRVTRITLPSVLAGDQLVIRAKGKKGGTLALDIAWRPW